MTTGVMLPRNIAAADVIGFAQKAERLGFDEVWVVEDLGYRGGIAQAAAVLAMTSTIRIGIGILPAGARNAAFDAMELATLEQLFPGRVDAGIGHGMPGWMKSVGAWPKSPLGLLEKHVNAVRGLMAGAGVDVASGALSDAPNAVRLDHTAVPAAVPDFLLGVRGPKSLELSGRIAEGTILAEPVSPEYLRAALVSIGAGVSGRGDESVAPPRTGDHRVVAYNFGVIEESDEAAIERLRPFLGGMATVDVAPHINPMPFAQEFRELAQQCATPEEFTARMPGEWILQLGLVGTVERVRERMDELTAAGASSNVFIPMRANAMDALDEFAAAL